MRPQKFNNVEQLDNQDQKERYTSIQLNTFYQILNGGLTFQDNFKSVFVDCTFTTVDTNTVVRHGLGVIPTGYIPITKSQAIDVYIGSSGIGSWDEKNISLRANSTGIVKMLIF